MQREHEALSEVAAFLEHVGRGRTDEVRARLAAMPSIVNAIGPHPFWGGRPQALHVAIEADRRDIFAILLAHGADIDGSNDAYDYWSPLMIAIHRQRHEMMDELMRRGVHVGVVEALMLGDDNRLADLLAAEALPAHVPNGGSLLAFARTPFAIDRLLALGVPADIGDRWGCTPVQAISRSGPQAQALVRHLAASGVVVRPEDYARAGDEETLARLCESDPSTARRDAVLMAAVEAGDRRLVEWLLARGGSANARTTAPPRHTALHAAAWNGDLGMVRLLVKAGANVSTRDDEHDAPPLGWALTALDVSNNAACAAVAEYLNAVSGNEA